MKMRFLGQTGLQVSELCLGSGGFGGLGPGKGRADVDQKEHDLVVGMALDAGINFFNTAERYSDGLAEEVLGKSLGARRKEAIIITKVHPMRSPGPNDGGLSRNHLIEGCNASLKRLGTDYIDLYELHFFDDGTPLEVTLRALNDLVHAGKVRYIGCSNFTGWQLMKSLAISREHGWESFMTIEAMYSLAARWLEFELVPLCLDQGVAILAYSPLNSGLLSVKYRRDQPWPEDGRFKGLDPMGLWQTEPEKLFKIIDELDRIAKEHDATMSQIALNYLLRKPRIASLIVGVEGVDQLKENLEAIDLSLTPEEIAGLDSISEPMRRYPYNIK